MYIITISRWKRKLAALLVVAVILIGVGWGINTYLISKDAEVAAPAEQNLESDVLNQPVKVQGEPAVNDNDPQPDSPPKSK